AVPLVSVQVQTDEISGNQLTQRFSYRKAFYDGIEREFHGFGLQLASDCEAQTEGARDEDYTAPVMRKTWYYVGDQSEPPGDGYFTGGKDA
ncbi:toxin TcdB middle/N-terminal domain-containing protein, partial [Brevibacterium sp. SIMBA_078]|uniref:toxin TcdB middle/N-terminal domain-containing protein n=1 Tax=Brevibacterium sp. SIMBA_078 TaxID=3085816 RepID=UPI00397C6550